MLLGIYLFFGCYFNIYLFPLFRNLRNRHIVLFLGASLSPQEILIVSEYMEKGSLRKFLSNEHKSSRKLRSHGGKLR